MKDKAMVVVCGIMLFATMCMLGVESSPPYIVLGFLTGILYDCVSKKEKDEDV